MGYSVCYCGFSSIQHVFHRATQCDIGQLTRIKVIDRSHIVIQVHCDRTTVRTSLPPQFPFNSIVKSLTQTAEATPLHRPPCHLPSPTSSRIDYRRLILYRLGTQATSRPHWLLIPTVDPITSPTTSILPSNGHQPRLSLKTDTCRSTTPGT